MNYLKCCIGKIKNGAFGSILIFVKGQQDRPRSTLIGDPAVLTGWQPWTLITLIVEWQSVLTFKVLSCFPLLSDDSWYIRRGSHSVERISLTVYLQVTKTSRFSFVRESVQFKEPSNLLLMNSLSVDRSYFGDYCSRDDTVHSRTVDSQSSIHNPPHSLVVQDTLS